MEIFAYESELNLLNKNHWIPLMFTYSTHPTSEKNPTSWRWVLGPSTLPWFKLPEYWLIAPQILKEATFVFRWDLAIWKIIRILGIWKSRVTLGWHKKLRTQHKDRFGIMELNTLRTKWLEIHLLGHVQTTPREVTKEKSSLLFISITWMNNIGEIIYSLNSHWFRASIGARCYVH